MATWYINDGDLPFLNEFPEMKEVDDAPISFWKIINGDLPFRNFAPMYTVDDAPIAFWHITDGELPYRQQFPEMFEFEPFGGIEHIIKGDDVVDNVYQGDTRANFVCLGDLIVFKQPIGR